MQKCVTSVYFIFLSIYQIPERVCDPFIRLLISPGRFFLFLVGCAILSIFVFLKNRKKKKPNYDFYCTAKGKNKQAKPKIACLFILAFTIYLRSTLLVSACISVSMWEPTFGENSRAKRQWSFFSVLKSRALWLKYNNIK